MIRSLSTGIRRFGPTQIESHSGVNWEFYAVVDGRCGVLLGSGEKLDLRSKCLWVFPPHHAHGWHGEKRHCSAVVVHCDAVPLQLAEVVPKDGFIEHHLTEAQCRQVADLGQDLNADFHHRDSLSELRFDRAILDLTLIALDGLDAPTPLSANRRIIEKVDAAMAWFRRHLREQPTMEQVAAAVQISPSHLRRLFIMALKQSPRAVLGNAQIEIALRLLSGSDLKIESVAAEAGFASARDFSRVFSAHQGCSPSDWRRAVQRPHVEHIAKTNGAVAV